MAQWSGWPRSHRAWLVQGITWHRLLTGLFDSWTARWARFHSRTSLSSSRRPGRPPSSGTPQGTTDRAAKVAYPGQEGTAREDARDRRSGHPAAGSTPPEGAAVSGWSHAEPQGVSSAGICSPVSSSSRLRMRLGLAAMARVVARAAPAIVPPTSAPSVLCARCLRLRPEPWAGSGHCGVAVFPASPPEPVGDLG